MPLIRIIIFAGAVISAFFIIWPYDRYQIPFGKIVTSRPKMKIATEGKADELRFDVGIIADNISGGIYFVVSIGFEEPAVVTSPSVCA